MAGPSAQPLMALTSAAASKIPLSSLLGPPLGGGAVGAVVGGASKALAVKPNKTTARNIPAFLNKLYTMVNDPETNELIRWSADGDSFFVPFPERFGKEVLPRFFKHSNFGSFVRQLNMYEFKKVPHLQQGVLKQDDDANDLLEFSNPNCTRSQPDLLCLIRRQKARTEPTVTETALNLPTLISDLAAIRQHQTAISADLKDLESSNRALWEEAIQSRERHTRHQETINKILRFLATVFGGQVAGGGLSGNVSEAGVSSPRSVPEEESPAASGGTSSQRAGTGLDKGKGKASEATMATPHMMSRFLLEDVKGRREARAREAEEDAAYELDDMEEISSSSQYVSSLPTLNRSNSNNYGYNSAPAANESEPSRFTTLGSNSGSPYNDISAAKSTAITTADSPYQLSPDQLSSLLSSSNPSSLAAILTLQNHGNSNATTASVPHQDTSRNGNYSFAPRLLSPPSTAASSTDPFSGFPLDPSLMHSLLPSLSPVNSRTIEEYSQSVLDHNTVLQEVRSEKADLDERTSQLEMAIARLMDGLPTETRDVLNGAGALHVTGSGLDGAGANGLETASPNGSESWAGKNVMGDAELDTFLAQYVNTANEDPASASSYLFNPISPVAALQPILPSYSHASTIDELAASLHDSDSMASTPAAGFVDPDDDDEEEEADAVGWNRSSPTSTATAPIPLNGRQTKRKSDAVESPGGEGTRRSTRKKVV